MNELLASTVRSPGTGNQSAYKGAFHSTAAGFHEEVSKSKCSKREDVGTARSIKGKAKSVTYTTLYWSNNQL